jgi:hypothetical protein
MRRLLEVGIGLYAGLVGIVGVIYTRTGRAETSIGYSVAFVFLFLGALVLADALRRPRSDNKLKF